MRLQYRELIQDALYNSSANKFRWHCIVCGQVEADEVLMRCRSCGGALDAIYSLKAVSQTKVENTTQRYWDFLPLRQRQSALWFGEGNTPCFRAARLGGEVGLNNIYLKAESTNPTRSTKDRIATIGLSRMAELEISEFVTSSTGNSATAFARALQIAGGFKAHIFIGQEFAGRLSYINQSDVIVHAVPAHYAQAGRMAMEFAEKNGVHFEGGFLNPAGRDGLKLAYLEAIDQMVTAPDHVFQAVSSGMGLLGAYKGLVEYHAIGRVPKVPRLHAVQQSSCAPMASAFAEGAASIERRHIIEAPAGLAQAILRGNPTFSYPYVASVCSETGGSITSATEADIRRARELLLDLEGIAVCYAGATALAGAIKRASRNEIASTDTVLVNLTGADRISLAELCGTRTEI
jgi:threonine synthase